MTKSDAIRPWPRPGCADVSDLHLRLTESDGSCRMDRITDVVLDLLFDLIQQAVRFGCRAGQWDLLAVYDADGYAAFIADGETA